MSEQAAWGTKLGQSDTGVTGSYSTFAYVRDFTGPALSTEFDESTNHSSTGSFNTFVPATKMVGEVTFECAFDPDPATGNVTGTISWWLDKSLESFNVTFPDGTEWYFTGYIQNFTPKAPVKGLLAADVTIKPSGGMSIA